MAKKITLDTPHAVRPANTEYVLEGLLIEYALGQATIKLRGTDGGGFEVVVPSIPATTQEQAILALVNNGILSGTIGDI